jgi:acetoin utilization protein AcuC
MNQPLFVVYDDIYLDWQLGSGDGTHPTNPIRAKLATQMLVDSLGDQAQVIAPTSESSKTRDLAALLATHDEGFVARTLAGHCSEWQGNRPAMGDAAFAMFAGTVRGVEAILAGEAKIVFNPQGAKHHAQFANASGFCAFNDMAYAASAFLAAGLKPLYIDWDIHAGDGVHEMLKHTPVPTISIHHDSTYPRNPEMQTMNGTRGAVHHPEWHSYNFSLLTGDGDDWFKKFIDEAAAIIDEYQPDVILVAAGADGHGGATNLAEYAKYTEAGFRYAAEMVAEKASAYSQGRVLIGGAGGYQPFKETPETWALVVETIYRNTKTGA